MNRLAKLTWLAIGCSLVMAACQPVTPTAERPSPLQPKSPLVSTELAAAATAGTPDPAGLVSALPKHTPQPIAVTEGQLTWQQGKLAAGAVAIFQFSAQAGQQVSLNVLSPNDQVRLVISGAVDQLPLQTEPSQTWAGSLPRSQAYQVSVIAADQPTDFLLNISVQPAERAAASPIATAVSEPLFTNPPDRIARTVSLPAFGTQSYPFDVQAGQTFSVQLSPSVPFTITNSSGDLYAVVNSETAAWQGELAAGTYRLTIGGLAAALQVTLTAELR